MRNSNIQNQSSNSDYSSEYTNISYEESIDIESLYDSSQQNSIKVTPTQAFNESIIKLLVLLYQIDGKVTLTEQDMFDEITASLDWRSGVSISAFINDAIHQARVAIDEDTTRDFLFSLGNGLNVNAAQSLEYAMNIAAADGERSEEELEILALLSNRVLARGLV